MAIPTSDPSSTNNNLGTSVPGSAPVGSTPLVDSAAQPVSPVAPAEPASTISDSTTLADLGQTKLAQNTEDTSTDMGNLQTVDLGSSAPKQEPIAGSYTSEPSATPVDVSSDTLAPTMETNTAQVSEMTAVEPDPNAALRNGNSKEGVVEMESPFGSGSNELPALESTTASEEPSPAVVEPVEDEMHKTPDLNLGNIAEVKSETQQPKSNIPSGTQVKPNAQQAPKTQAGSSMVTRAILMFLIIGILVLSGILVYLLFLA